MHVLGGEVPQLPQGELIGRRRELRSILKTLRDPARPYSGVVLTGIGGVGKSALAGRVMARQAELGWLVPAVRGPFSLTGIAIQVGLALMTAGRAPDMAELLAQPELDDRLRGPLLGRALAEHPILLVLDDFEQNLATGGDAFLNPDVADQLRALARQARTGRLLITCRHPLPGFNALLQSFPVPPLSPAETRKKLLRLPALDPHATVALKAIGGHPRMLEFLDALLSADPSRSRSVGERLAGLAAECGVDITRAVPDLDTARQIALTLEARDILLDELLAIVRREGHEAALLQTAVSHLPVSAAGLARMLASDDSTGDATAAAASLSRLAALSLLHLGTDGALVHRWTAEALATQGGAAAYRARCERAASYRLWRANHQSHALGDVVEALRNWLTGGSFDAAAGLALELFALLSQARQSVAVAALAAEVLEELPESHPGFAPIADAEASAHLALGASDRAFCRYISLQTLYEEKSKAAPDRADYQRDLSISYERVGDLYRALGQGEAARDAFAKALAITETLARNEPDRADYQRDLSVSYNKMGDLYRALGQGEAARDAFAKALAIAETLARNEPDRADYQRDLSVSYNKMGDLYRALGQGEAARDAFAKALAIAEKLARNEPDRADYQRDLSVSYERVGDLHAALGQGEAARDAFAKALAIRETLARNEPDRADYQRDLSVSYNKMGDLYAALGQGEAARDAFAKALAIAETLARNEPDRADYQRDLSVSYERVGDLYRALGQGEAARDAFAKALAIRETLARNEPDRADYQRDLSVSYNKMGDLYAALGQTEAARDAFAKDLAIAETLARNEPDRADYQRDLSISYERMGDSHGALEERDAAFAAYDRARIIHEALAVAEPDRADYQRDLAVCLLRQCQFMAADDARGNLERALDIVEALDASGRLQLVDASLLETLRQRVQGLAGGAPGQPPKAGPDAVGRRNNEDRWGPRAWLSRLRRR